MVQQYQQGLLADPPEKNPTQVVNKSFIQGAEQDKRQYNVNQQNQAMANAVNTVVNAAQFMGADPQQQQSLGQQAMQRYFQNQGLGFKINYARAAANGDEAGMQAASEGATALRDLASQHGINMDGFGADNTLAQAQMQMGFNNAQRYGQLLDEMDSGSYYDRLYDDYIRQGMKPQYADQYASAKAREYQNNRLGKLRDEFFANGIDMNSGTFNNYGVQLIDMMRAENPDSITSIATLLPGPMQDYTYRTGERQKDNALTRTLKLTDVQNAFKNMLADKQIAAQLQKAYMDNETKRYLGNLSASVRSMAGGGRSTQTNATGDSAKGEKFVLNFLSNMEDIQNNPETFKENPYDHRLKNAPKEIEKALNNGIIDSTMADTLFKVLAQTHNDVWGAANVRENALRENEEY